MSKKEKGGAGEEFEILKENLINVQPRAEDEPLNVEPFIS